MAALLETYGWHEWLCHTNFSFLIGASHPSDYVERASQLGYASMAITDFDGVYGIVRAHRARKGLPEQAWCPKVHYGAEVHLTTDHSWPVLYQDTLALVAQTHRGYRNLCRILTHAHRGGKHDANVTIGDLLCSDLHDLVAIQPMRGLARRTEVAPLIERLGLLKEAFGNRLHLALSLHMHPSENRFFGRMQNMGKRFSIPCLLSQDCFFHERSQKPVSDVLQAMRLNRHLDEVGSHLFPNTERCFLGLDELEVIYGRVDGYESMLRHSRELSESCQFDLSELRYHYPQELVPEGMSSQDYLEHLTWQAAARFYHQNIPPHVDKLLKHELALVRQLGFSDYFLTVWDIVRWAREQHILCQGRGSAANSAICFVLGITSVDPSLFDTLFERFLSAERGDPPDIDVDFEHERREEVIQYIYRRFGRKRAAMVANVITFRSRGALRFVGKALGVPEKIISQTSRLLEIRQFRQSPVSEAIQQVAQEHEQPQEVCWDLWSALTQAIKGFPRHLGVHSGGFVIADQELNGLVHQEPATMEGRTVIAWSKDDIEALGFFKIDVLSLGMLSAIRKCIDYVQQTSGDRIRLHEIPRDDAPTFEMIQKADTVGTFQVESRAQMAMLPRLRPQCFYDLVVEVGIVRPGPIQGGFIQPYLRRRRGEEPVVYPHPLLQPILQRTLGVPIFQEQIMRMAMAVGGFSAGEADELRRQMGAWQFKGDLAPLVKRLATGMRRFGIAEKFVQQILKQVKGFAEYGFPESHAASFAHIAYVSCYLKRHHPVAFLAGLLNSQPMGFYSPHALLQDAKRHGIEILPICVMHSEWDCTLEKHPNDHGEVKSHQVGVTLRHPWRLRLGFRMVSGLRHVAAEAMLLERKQKQWSTINDFLQRAPLFRGDISALAAANAFASLGVARRQAIWLADAVPVAPALEENLGYRFPKETSVEAMEADFAATSTSLGPHPVNLVKSEYWCYSVKREDLSPSHDLISQTSGRKVYVFGMVLVRQAPPSANGMVFLTLEDETGYVNLVFTPPVYERYQSAIHSQGFLCVQGTLQVHEGAHSVLVNRVYETQVPRADIIPIDGVDKGEQQQRTRLQAQKEASKLIRRRGLAEVRHFM